MIDNYLDGLNDAQKEAVLEFTRPLLVLSGAGSGKTRVVTTKIAYAIQRLNIPAYNILALTFTNKAANEMKDRVLSMIDADLSGLIIKTFHSFGVYFLRIEGHVIGLRSDFSILDDTDSIALFRILYPNMEKKTLKIFYSMIMKNKEQGIKSNDFNDFFLTQEAIEKLPYNHDEMKTRALNIYKRYETKLKELGDCDFADLILKPVEILREFKDIREKYQNRFKIILVDEYQDSNSNQFNLLKLLYNGENFICTVGDDDQSIYGFRGAKIEHILNFSKQYPNTKIVTLGQNYRSTSNILNLASAVIEKNLKRHKKDIYTENDKGDEVIMISSPNNFEEADKIANMIKEGGIYKDTAILYRTNYQSRLLEKSLKSLSIPYKLVGGISFYQREEIKMVMSLIKLFFNPYDTVSFNYISEKLIPRIGAKALEKIENYLNENSSLTYLDAMTNISGIKGKYENLVTTFENLALSYEHNSDNYNLIVSLLDGSGALKHYTQMDEREESSRIENINIFLDDIKETYTFTKEKLVEFLDTISLDSISIDEDEEENAVTLITMHNTKGLEYSTVYISGLIDGLIPSSRATSPSDIEEERRILYVAITRAKKKLILSYYKKLNADPRELSYFIKNLNGNYYKLLESENKSFYSFDSLSTKRSYNSYATRKISYNRDYDEYENYNSGYNSQIKKSEPIKVKSSKYSKGDTITHSEYGDGFVIRLIPIRGNAGIEILFKNGRTVTELTTSDKITLKEKAL